MVMFTFRMLDSANVISSSLSVVLPGSITDGRTAMGGTLIMIRPRGPYRDVAENHVFWFYGWIVKSHEARILRRDAAEDVLRR